jgi:SAM-dependent methyltransferase
MTDDFYRAFEDRYRGSRELIKSRLRVYLPFVEPLKALYADATAIDLGCGRGEWLELMGETGFNARGVDLDDGMLAACVERGLSAERGDAIAYLRALPDASVAVVSAFHVVEHIPFEELQQLVQEALRVLKPAGLLILETPNPENLSVGASKFYYDPTHEKPIPPALLSFLPDHYGFARTKVLRLQDRPGLVAATEIGLNDVLSGVSPDYSVVAQMGSDRPAELALFDAAFTRDFGVDLDTLATRYDAQVGSRLAEILTRVDRSAELEAQARADLAARDREIERLHTHIAWQQGEWDGAKGELAQARADLAARDREIERLHTHIAWQQGEWDGAKGELAQARADLAARDREIERLHAHIAWQQGGWDGVKAELFQTQERLVAVDASTSWRVTGPLRSAMMAARRLKALTARAVLGAKIRFKPVVAHASAAVVAQVAALAKRSPGFRRFALRVMELSPRLARRLLKVRVEQAAAAHPEAMPWTDAAPAPQAVESGDEAWSRRGDGIGINAQQRGPLEAAFGSYVGTP